MAHIVNKVSTLVTRLMNQARPQWDVFIKYAKVELTPADIPAIRQSIEQLVESVQSGAYKNVTVREAWLNTLVTAEIIFWFYIGECIGKRHLIGYDV